MPQNIHYHSSATIFTSDVTVNVMMDQAMNMVALSAHGIHYHLISRKAPEFNNGEIHKTVSFVFSSCTGLL